MFFCFFSTILLQQKYKFQDMDTGSRTRKETVNKQGNFHFGVKEERRPQGTRLLVLALEFPGIQVAIDVHNWNTPIYTHQGNEGRWR